jgi:hypothetical protein
MRWIDTEVSSSAISTTKEISCTSESICTDALTDDGSHLSQKSLKQELRLPMRINRLINSLTFKLDSKMLTHKIPQTTVSFVAHLSDPFALLVSPNPQADCQKLLFSEFAGTRTRHCSSTTLSLPFTFLFVYRIEITFSPLTIFLTF